MRAPWSANSAPQRRRYTDMYTDCAAVAEVAPASRQNAEAGRRCLRAVSRKEGALGPTLCGESGAGKARRQLLSVSLMPQEALARALESGKRALLGALEA